MRNAWLFSARVCFTLAVVAVAGYALWRTAGYYMFSPWTRDGHVRADVVQVAPDVGGLITEVDVVDSQPVKRGQRLFVIDQARYTLAVRQAQAILGQRRAVLDQAIKEDRRNKALGNLVPAEVTEEGTEKVELAQAQVNDAQVALDTAQLNLHRTTIVSPVDGYLNDRAPRLGEFATAGHSVLSVVDEHSFRVDGYFEETKIHGISVGDPVDIQILGDSAILRGHVDRIVAGIEDRDESQSSNLLPNVDPAYSWVRLAQRVPVRIALDDVPANFKLIAGRTATVWVHQAKGVKGAHEDPLYSGPGGVGAFIRWMEGRV
jgi:multidrug resistance efflux pump